MKRTFRHAFAAALLALATGGCGGSQSAEDAHADAAPVVPVNTVALATRSFRAVVSAPGEWRTTSEAVVAAPFAAFVESLPVAPGDVVARGATLGVLVTRDSRAAVLGAEQLLLGATDAVGRAEAERALAQARHDLVRVPLRAGAAGVVVRRPVVAGAEVAEGAELLAIVPPGAIVFEAHVPASAAAGVRAGLAASVRTEDGRALAATVQRLLPQAAAADQSALAWLAPAQPPAPGSIGRYATAEIELGAARRAVAVPDSALVEDDLTGEVRVATVTRGLATWVPVTLGLAADGWHELRTPALAAGTAVIVRGQRGLPDSTRVASAP